jgi:DNA-binding response OmpR family regulator
MAGRILSISYDRGLLRARQELLEAQGYSVISCSDREDALECCQVGSFDLVVIGHSIPHRDKEQFMAAFRPTYHAPILALVRADEGTVPGVLGASETLDVGDGPAVLLATIRRLISRAQAA